MTSTPDVTGAAGDLAVGMVGYAFMGAAHSQAWRTAPRFFDLPLHPRMTALVGRDATRVAAAADRLGWSSTETSWKALIARDDIDLVDICTPGDTHAEIAIAALEAGKHVLCEKPLANTVAEAEAMTAAADKAAAHGVRSMVGFTYRRVPAIALARQLVAEGRLGTLHHVRAQYLQDWIVDPQAPLSWRLDKSKAGSGCPRRHRCPHHRPRPVHHRRQHREGLRPAAHLRRRASPGERARRALGHRGHGHGHGHRRRRRDVPRGVPRGSDGRLRGDPVRQRAEERHPHRDQRLRRQPGLRLRGHEPPALLRRHRGRPHRRLPPDPRHRGGSTPTSARGGRPAT